MNEISKLFENIQTLGIFKDGRVHANFYDKSSMIIHSGSSIIVIKNVSLIFLKQGKNFVYS